MTTGCVKRRNAPFISYVHLFFWVQPPGTVPLLFSRRGQGWCSGLLTTRQHKKSSQSILPDPTKREASKYEASMYEASKTKKGYDPSVRSPIHHPTNPGLISVLVLSTAQRILRSGSG